MRYSIRYSIHVACWQRISRSKATHLVGAGYWMPINFQIDANPKIFSARFVWLTICENSQVSHRELSISSVCIASDAQFTNSIICISYVYNVLQSGAKVSENANALWRRGRAELVYIVYRLAEWVSLWGLCVCVGCRCALWRHTCVETRRSTMCVWRI